MASLEEVVFRDFNVQRLQVGLCMRPAVLISALLWALSHLASNVASGVSASNLVLGMACSNVEPTLFPLAVGVVRGIGATKRVGRLADNIVEDLFGHGSTELVAAHLPSVQIDADRLRVVIQHALKVGRTVQYVWFPADGATGVGIWPRHGKRQALRPRFGEEAATIFLTESHNKCTISSLPDLGHNLINYQAVR